MSEKPININLDEINQQVRLLTEQVKFLTEKIENRSRGQEYQETIRDIVIYDSDSKSSISSGTTAVVVGVDFVGQTVTTAPVATLSSPTILLRVYFRGKPYNMPAYALP